MIVENGAHRAIGSSADFQSPAAGRIDPLALKRLDETDDAQAGPVTLLGMRPIGENTFAEQRDVRSNCRRLPADALDRPVGKAAMGRWHMLRRRRVLAIAARAPVSGDPLTFVEDLDGVGRDPRLDLLTGKPIGHGVIMLVDIDMIIEASPADFPFRKDISLDGQRGAAPGNQALRTAVVLCARHGVEHADR